MFLCADMADFALRDNNTHDFFPFLSLYFSITKTKVNIKKMITIKLVRMKAKYNPSCQFFNVLIDTLFNRIKHNNIVKELIINIMRLKS